MARTATASPSLRTIDSPAFGNAADIIGHTIEVDPNRIHITPEFRVRNKAPNDEKVIDRLKSIRTYGQRTAINVLPSVKHPGAFDLIDGETRLTAFLWMRNGHKRNPEVKADEKVTIRAYVEQPGQRNGKQKLNAQEQSIERIALAYRANADHNKPTPMDMMRTYQVLRENKADNNECGRILGVSQVWLKQLRDLEKADPRIQALVEDGLLPAKAATDTVGLDSAHIERIVAVTRKAHQDASRAVTLAKSGIAADAAKAAKEAQRAKDAAAAEGKKAVGQARTEQPKATSGKGRPKADAKWRTPEQISSLFASIMATKGIAPTLKTFANEVCEFCHNRSSSQKVITALRNVASGVDDAPKAQKA